LRKWHFKAVEAAALVFFLAFAFLLTQDGSLPDRLLHRGAETFVKTATSGTAATTDAALGAVSVRADAQRVAEWAEAHRRNGHYPSRVKVQLDAGNDLEAYQRTKTGFRLCIRNEAGPWATWLATRQQSELAVVGRSGECRYE